MDERFALSDGCQLKVLDEADAEELHRLVDANRSYLAPRMPWASEQTREATLEFIRLTRRQVKEKKGFQVAIVCEDQIIGVAGFHHVESTHRSGTIGYWMDEQHQGRGIMTRAVRALIDQAFRDWGLNRVEIRAATDNPRSRAIPERLGFREEGVLREAERIGDRYNDLVVYGMLASEWVHEGG